MCVNYIPIQRKILRDVFGVEPPQAEWPPEVWPDYMAPIVRADMDGQRDCVLANFRMMPHGRIEPGRKKFETANARLEDLPLRSSFRGPWKRGQLCLVPMHAFFEPNYEQGPRSVRYRIWLKDEPAFAVAGLWQAWADGLVSFTMLTLGALGHPLMSRMHAPGKEKRSIAILPRDRWDGWLTCRNPEQARLLLDLYPADRMEAAPDPVLPPKTQSSAGAM